MIWIKGYRVCMDIISFWISLKKFNHFGFIINLFRNQFHDYYRVIQMSQQQKWAFTLTWPPRLCWQSSSKKVWTLWGLSRNIMWLSSRGPRSDNPFEFRNTSPTAIFRTFRNSVFSGRYLRPIGEKNKSYI